MNPVLAIRNLHSAPLIAGVIAAQLMGGLVTQLAPFVIDGLIKGLSLSQRDAGFVASCELLTLAVSALVIAPVVAKVPYRHLSIMAATLTLFAQVGSIFSTSLLSLAALRGVSGIGEGTLYAVSISVVAARMENPEKIYGYFQIAWTLGSIALFPVAGNLTTTFANRGVFGLIAAVSLLLAPLLLLIPNTTIEKGRASIEEAEPAKPVLGIMVLVAMGLYMAAVAGLYAFSVPLGELAGLSTDSVGFVMTIGSLFGFAGATAATALNVRWGRLIPIFLSCAGFILIALTLCMSRDRTAYIVALVAFFVIYYFSIPYMLGLAAALDRAGRWAAAASSAYLQGFAVGPLLAGTVIATVGYSSFAVICVTFTAASFSLAAVANRQLSNGLGGIPHSTVP